MNGHRGVLECALSRQEAGFHEVAVVLVGYFLTDFQPAAFEDALLYLGRQLKVQSLPFQAKVCQSLLALESSLELIPLVQTHVAL